jgi:glycosyltransferase involved in cell wall biosynthesis
MFQSSITTEPLVSVVIPAYNAALHLSEAVESLFAQTHKNLQIIIVNDGSKDDTAKVADALAQKDKRVEVIHKANGGVSAARNDAFKAVKGEYVCFLDADDVYLPEKVAKQVNFLEAHPEVVLVHCDYFIGNETFQNLERVYRGNPPAPLGQVFIYCNWFPPLTPMLRASLVKKVGFFDTTLAGGEDWDYWIRCLEHGKFEHINEFLAMYRRHSKQSHHNQGMMRRDETKAIERRYGQNPRKYRVAMGARNWFYAKMYKWYGKPLPMLRELVLFVLNVRNPFEMRLIMKAMDE